MIEEGGARSLSHVTALTHIPRLSLSHPQGLRRDRNEVLSSPLPTRRLRRESDENQNAPRAIGEKAGGVRMWSQIVGQEL